MRRDGSTTPESEGCLGMYTWVETLRDLSVSKNSAFIRLWRSSGPYIAYELGSGTTRINGWEYDSITVHNGTEVSIIHMLAHVPEPHVRALANGIRMRM